MADIEIERDLQSAEGASIAEQRRALPDEPGVYIFRDKEGKVLYVGKARSIRKRVGGHFSGKTRTRAMTEQAASIEFLVTNTEADALLAEQQFIKRHRPTFNIRLRDDKSYPYIGISLDEEFPRVYFTRERHRSARLYFGPYSNAKRTRETLEILGKLFQYRTCDGPEPGRRSGVPCLDYYIKRCQAPCVGYIDREEYRRNIDAIASFLSGRYRDVERDLERKMEEAVRRRGVRARRRLPRPPRGGPLAHGAPQRGGGGHGQRRRDRGRGRGRHGQRPGLPGPRRHPGRAPELLPDQRR